MKYLFSIVALVALFISPATAANGEGQGSLPSASQTSRAETADGKEIKELEPGAFSKKKVKPGKTHDNGDTVVENTGDSGNITVDPANGNANSSTDIVVGTGAEGDITGVDSNDTVTVGSSAEVNITGTGGSITTQGGSSGTVTNSGGTGSSNMTVTLPGGSSITVPPGSNITFNN